MKRVHKTLPIYSTLGCIPEHAIYALAPSTHNRKYHYLGESRDVVARYKKYEGLARRTTTFGHESQEKIDFFREHYSKGASPIMVILADIAPGENPKEIEKLYRGKYTSMGHPLMNATGKQRSYAKNTVKKIANDTIDTVWGSGGVLALIVAGIVLFIALSGRVA